MSRMQQARWRSALLEAQPDTKIVCTRHIWIELYSKVLSETSGVLREEGYELIIKEVLDYWEYNTMIHWVHFLNKRALYSSRIDFTWEFSRFLIFFSLLFLLSSSGVFPSSIIFFFSSSFVICTLDS